MDMAALVQAVNAKAGTKGTVKQETTIPLNPQTQQPKPVLQTAPQTPIVASDPKVHTDSRYVDVSSIMPSKLALYDKKTLAVRPFSGHEIQKMHRAIVEQAFRHEVDAMGACITMSPYDLTVGDFHWLMYWQRVNSYKKVPHTIPWRCVDVTHVAAVGEGKKNADTLDNEFVMTNSSLQEVPLKVEEANEFARNFFANYGLYLDVARVGDLVEDEEGEQNSENAWYNKYASHINRKHYGSTIAERRAYFKGWLTDHPDPEILDELEDWIELVEHDVKEIAETTCKECGATEKITLLISPLNFLPGRKLRNS